MERLIVDARGTERIIRPFSPYVPEVPEGQKIVFPDKKQYAIDWRKNLTQLSEIYKTIKEAEIVQEEGIYRVPFSNPEIPYAVGFVFSDAHIGSYSSDHDLVRDLLETVLATPNGFLVDAGDTFDNGIWGGLSHEGIMPAYMQAFTIEDIIREFGEKYAACVIGNHPEWMFQASGVKPEYMFARQMKGVVFAGMGLLHLEVGEQKYDWALAHSFWGKSKKNIFNVCVNLRQQEYPDADVFTVGHEHIWGHMKEMVDGRERLYIRPGTAKTSDRYARIHGIAKRGQSMGIAVVFGAKERSFGAYSIEEAVKLQFLRKEIAGLSGIYRTTTEKPLL
jgi:hypothetical protein